MPLYLFDGKQLFSTTLAQPSKNNDLMLKVENDNECLLINFSCFKYVNEFETVNGYFRPEMLFFAMYNGVYLLFGAFLI